MTDRYINNNMLFQIMLIKMKRASIAASVTMKMLEYIEILKNHIENHMSTILRANESENERIQFLYHKY